MKFSFASVASTSGAAAIFLLLAVSVYGQKGVDTQTQTIKADGNKVTTRSTDASRSFDWGKDKTHARALLPNPYKLTSRRDALISSIVDVLRENRIVVDEASSRMANGLIVTQPFVFSKGAVITQNEINRYAVLDGPESTWSRGQYTLTIEVQPIDGTQNNVSVVAKIEGRAGNGLSSEWITLRSSGLAEDEFLAKLVEAVTGATVNKVVENP
jgi:hypothetical protein